MTLIKNDSFTFKQFTNEKVVKNTLTLCTSFPEIVPMAKLDIVPLEQISSHFVVCTYLHTFVHE